MTDYRALAAGELSKIRRDNNELRNRAVKARADGEDARAAELDAVATATSFRLAEDYIALAALSPDVPPPAAEDAPDGTP